MNIKKTLSIMGYASWCGLGFIRGINSYNYNRHKYKKKEDLLYLDAACGGFGGALFYAAPFSLPFTLHKEIYRLEVNLRNLENEKNTNYYNRLL